MPRPAAPVVLADLLALAILEHGPASGSRLARRLHVRKAAVLAELHASPQFACFGRGRGARWLVAPVDRRGTGQEPQRGDAGFEVGVTAGLAVLDRLAALERRVAELEQRAGSEAPA